LHMPRLQVIILVALCFAALVGFDLV